MVDDVMYFKSKLYVGLSILLISIIFFIIGWNGPTVQLVINNALPLVIITPIFYFIMIIFSYVKVKDSLRMDRDINTVSKVSMKLGLEVEMFRFTSKGDGVTLVVGQLKGGTDFTMTLKNGKCIKFIHGIDNQKNI